MTKHKTNKNNCYQIYRKNLFQENTQNQNISVRLFLNMHATIFRNNKRFIFLKKKEKLQL